MREDQKMLLSKSQLDAVLYKSSTNFTHLTTDIINDSKYDIFTSQLWRDGKNIL